VDRRNTLIAILVIATALLWCGWGGVSLAQTNLIPNPGFEHDHDGDGIPDTWKRKASQDNRLCLEHEAYKGTHGVSIAGKGTWRCRFKGRLPQGWYLFSVRVKRGGFVDGEYPLIRIFGREIPCDELFNWGVWVRWSRLLYLEEDRKKVEIALVNPGMRHTVWFDDVSLVPFTCTIMYPKDGGVVTQGPPLFVWRMPEDGRVYEIRIELEGEDGVHKTYTTYSPLGNLYWLEESLLPGTYWWRAQVFHNGVFVAASRKEQFIVAKTLLLAPGKDSSPLLPARTLEGFFPLGIYRVPIEALGEIERVGFNAVQTYKRDAEFLKEYIKRAKDLGLKVMIPYPDGEDPKTLHAFLDEVKASWAILAWYLADEPEGRGGAPTHIWRWRRFLRTYTPFPGAVVLVRASRAWDYAPATDILMVDPYPIPQMPITWLSDSLEEAKQGGGGRPVWAVIQAFDWSAVPLEDGPRAWGRYPTYEEERCLSYLSLVHGAEGLFYYTFEAQKFGTEDYQQHWDNIRRVIAELRSIYPLLLAPSDSTYPIKSDTPQIHWALKRVQKKEAGSLIQKGRYLIAVNTVNKPLTAQFSIPPLGVDEVGVLLEKRVVSIRKGRLIDAFEPYGVHIYGPLTH
jgi:hypothetical protein